MNKLKNVKIVFVDIDGTLSNSKKQISEETKNAIKKATRKGLIVVLCSGRCNEYVCKYSKLANASKFVISCNGAQIFDYKNNTSIYQKKLDFFEIKKIWDYCNENSICCILNSNNKRYCNSFEFYGQEDKIYLNNISNIKNQNIYQIVSGSNTFDSIYNLEKYINTNTNSKIVNASNCYINKNINENHYFLDITNKNVSKGNAIKELLSFLNLKKEDAIGFGDHINDFDLFKEVGFKIAMSNAMQQLKDKADYITISNDDNGVAYFLNNYIDYE